MGEGGSLIGGGIGSAGVRRRKGGSVGIPNFVSSCMAVRCQVAFKGSRTANADHPNADAVRCSSSSPFTTNGFVNHMRTNRQPLVHLLLLNARGDGPFACRASVFAEFLLQVISTICNRPGFSQ
jgi:hypothetical protein